MLEVTITTLPHLLESGYEIELLLEWEVIEQLQTIASGGFDNVQTVDVRVEPVSDFIARHCVDFARETGQAALTVVLPSSDFQFMEDVSQSRIRTQTEKLSNGEVRVSRFRLA